MRDLDELRAYNRMAQRRYRAKHGTKPYEPHIIHFDNIECASSRPTQEMLEDAARRANAPRTVTSRLCGDPAPGQSAWDKMQPQQEQS